MLKFAVDVWIMRYELSLFFFPFFSTLKMILLYFLISIIYFNLIGPYGVNGVPLRRVNQRYVIATSTKVDMAGVNVSRIDDVLFARTKVVKQKNADAMFVAKPEGTVTSPDRKALQTAIDSALIANIKKENMLESYLKALFTLSKADKPHSMKF